MRVQKARSKTSAAFCLPGFSTGRKWPEPFRDEHVPAAVSGFRRPDLLIPTHGLHRRRIDVRSPESHRFCACAKKFEKKQKKLLTIRGKGAIIIKHLSGAQKTSKSARVVELVDSPASGAGAHSGRGGSTPPSRTSSIPEIVMISGIVFLLPKKEAGDTGLSPRSPISNASGPVSRVLSGTLKDP